MKESTSRAIAIATEAVSYMINPEDMDIICKTDAYGNNIDMSIYLLDTDLDDRCAVKSWVEHTIKKEKVEQLFKTIRVRYATDENIWLPASTREVM